MLGTRKYILKEENKTLPEARSNLRRIYFLNRLFYVMLVLGLWHTFSLSSLFDRFF